MCGRYTLKEDADDMEAWFEAVIRGFENFAPNYNVAPSHTMPVMLLKEEFDEWLDPENQNTKSLKELLKPFPDDAIDFHQVNKKVGKVSNNSPDLMEAV